MYIIPMSLVKLKDKDMVCRSETLRTSPKIHIQYLHKSINFKIQCTNICPLGSGGVGGGGWGVAPNVSL